MRAFCSGPSSAPAAHEAQMMALEQPALVGRQAERIALPVQRIDAGEQRRRRA